VKTSIWDTLYLKSKQAYERKGIRYMLKVGIKMSLEIRKNSIFLWYYRRGNKSKTFLFQGKTYHYLIHPYCTSWKNERAVVIPIFKDILKKCEDKGKKILEVGNTLSYVYPVSHDILDKYEIVDGVINEDVVTFSPGKQYDMIFSVVSMQCIGWDEVPRDSTKILGTLKNLNKLLTPDGQLLLSLGLGYNPEMDKLLKKGVLGFDKIFYLKRISELEWKEVAHEDIEDAKYDESVPTSTILAICISNKK
jgi:SAM-dependent methyltransferase